MKYLEELTLDLEYYTPKEVPQHSTLYAAIEQLADDISSTARLQYKLIQIKQRGDAVPKFLKTE